MIAACDIGTTTIAISVFDDNECYDNVMENPNRLYGSDVISRMNNAAKYDLLHTMCDDLRSAIFQAIFEVSEDIDLLVISGNTLMMHIFFEWDVSGMLSYPFSPFRLDSISESVHDIPVISIPCISAFVGGDIVSGIYEVYKSNASGKYKLLVDLGTNGELVLYGCGKLYTASVAAGPAFEGGNISCGMAAIDGAIDSVNIKKGFCRITTINDTLPPKGICGSGLIDAVYSLYNDGLIDSHGSFISEKYRTEGFRLYSAPHSKDIILKQEDVRSLQTAKAAVAAGITALCIEADVTFSDISSVYIAGSFGEHLNLMHATEIGLIPDKLCQRISLCGNSSLLGAIRLAKNPSDIDLVKKIASSATPVSLAVSEAFKDAYINSMDL